VIRKQKRTKRRSKARKGAATTRHLAVKSGKPGFTVLQFPHGMVEIREGVLIDLSCLFPPRRPKVIVIKNGKPGPKTMVLRAGYRPDRVVWVNRDDRDHLVVFASWPFKLPEENIYVPAHGHSRAYTVRADATHEGGPYSYDIPDTPQEGPGGPEIEVGP